MSTGEFTTSTAPTQTRPALAGRLTQATYAHLGLALCLVLALIPILSTPTPPLFDYPNHLARVHVIAHWADTPLFRANFEITSFLIPNVLADVVLLGLMPLGGVEVAGRVFLALILALTLTGGYALNRAVAGRFTVWSLLIAALLYNEMFMWGFLNYMLGLGLLLWGLAAWLSLDGRHRTTQLILATAFALLTFFAHLVAFALYAIAIAVIELRRAWVVRRRGLLPAARHLIASAAPFIPPLILFFAVSPSGKLPFDPQFDYSQFGKLTPFTRLLSAGNPTMDMVTLVSVTAVVAIALAARRITLHWGLALTGLVYLALILSLPYSMLGSYFVDSRIVIALAFILVAAIRPRRDSRRRGTIFLAVLLIGLMTTRSVALAEDWRAQGHEFGRLLAAFDKLPRGSLLIPAVGHPFELGDWIATRYIKPSHEHSTLYATIRRGVLVSNIFARRGQNPLVLTPVLDDIGKLSNPVSRILNQGDSRWVVNEVMQFLDQLDEIQPAIRNVYVVGYKVRCDYWPEDLPIRPVACDNGFSLFAMDRSWPVRRMW
ncbi:MAG TPA: hypothetical protein VEB64_13690 [Azospirillaceae bacterium]|nr:hypothetical protein [Azospirillaceae bacterium]